MEVIGVAPRLEMRWSCTAHHSHSHHKNRRRKNNPGKPGGSPHPALRQRLRLASTRLVQLLAIAEPGSLEADSGSRAATAEIERRAGSAN